MKGKVLILISMVTAFFAFGLKANALTLEEMSCTGNDTKPCYYSAEKHLYANGNSITISAREDGIDGAVVSFDGGSVVIGSDVVIYGGGKDLSFSSSNITMNGGVVQGISGAGFGTSPEKSADVDKVNITINNGKVKNALFAGGDVYSKVKEAVVNVKNGYFGSGLGGGGEAYYDSTYNLESYKNDSVNSPNRVENVTIVVDNAEYIYHLIGGGNSYSYVGKSTVTVNNGTIDYFTAGGSNGYTKDTNVTINGGKIDVLQGVNRGTVASSTVEVNAGEITNMYVGGESGDSGVTGVLEEASVIIKGGNVTNLSNGTSGGVVINKDTPIVSDITYVEGTVTNVKENIGDTANELKKGNIIINNNTGGTININNVTGVLEGSVVNYSIALENGYKLSELIITDKDGNKIDYKNNSFIMPEGDVTITAKYVKNEANNVVTDGSSNNSETNISNPQTFDGVGMYMILSLLSIGGLTLLKRKKLA